MQRVQDFSAIALCPIRIFVASMFLSCPFSFPTLSSCRMCLGVARFSTFGLPTHLSTIFPATVRLRRYASTMPLSLVDHVQQETQKTVSVSAERIGQSGRRYSIERVLQERDIPVRRVYLATYVPLRFNSNTIYLANFR